MDWEITKWVVIICGLIWLSLWLHKRYNEGKEEREQPEEQASEPNWEVEEQ